MCGIDYLFVVVIVVYFIYIVFVGYVRDKNKIAKLESPRLKALLTIARDLN